MSETAKFWGAHAPRVLRLAPSPIDAGVSRRRAAVIANKIFGEAPKWAREGAHAPQNHAAP